MRDLDVARVVSLSSVNVERDTSGNTTNVAAMIAWYDSRARFWTAA